MEGKAMVPARLLSAFAKDEVRLKVLVTPVEIVLVIVSLRLRLGRIILGEGGCGDGTLERMPPSWGVLGSDGLTGGIWSEVDSKRVNGDSRRSATT